MDIKRDLIEGEEFKLPCIQFTPSKSKGAAVIVHGYGGSKEEQLGLAWRVALKGITTCAIDIRGHGENPNSLDRNILTDLEVAISYCRQFGKVAAIGHSLGGRLALVSSADYAVKRVIHIKVVKEENVDVMGYTQSFVRNILRIIDGLFFYIVGIILIDSSDKNQRLGDRAAHTLVIKEK
ncbi:MAG: alpha/beta fold hydrolase [Methanobacterium paludis]|nr:alpha/beta fold hydrolase [Methanobacterium paludis]